MKKLLSLLLVASLLFSAVSLVSVSAADYIVDDGVLVSYSGSASSFTIPSDVYYIADSVFEGNTKLKSVNLNNVSVIGNRAFCGCSALAAVTGGNNVATCGAYAFDKTPYLDDNSEDTVILGSALIKSRISGAYSVPATVSSLAPYSFADNYGITSVAISSRVAEIGEGAFFNCSSLSDVNISNSVGYIGAYAFEGTPWLSSNNDTFVIAGAGILIDVNSSASSLTIPDTVRHIAAAVFSGNTTLKSIQLPKTLSGIGKRAFYNCVSLSSIEFPTSVVMIDDEAFSGCVSLDSVVIPSSVKILGESVFFSCSGLKNATVCSETDISAGLFAGCTDLTSVIIGCEAQTIGDYAFFNCFSLEEISIPDTINNFDFTTFGGITDFTVYCNEGSFIEHQCNTSGVKNTQIGDANMDGNINIRDASHIQKATAAILTLNFSESLRGDVDFNGVINVKDATRIQKMIAGLV